MSKTDAMRAMKQARAAALSASRPAAPSTARPAPARAAAAPAPAAGAAVPVLDAPVPDLVPEALCGHQAIGGRRCTRPQGHAEKNHRYAT